MKRDSFACVLCAASGHGVRLEIDHKIPFSQGGDDSIENLQTLCFAHHQSFISASAQGRLAVADEPVSFTLNLSLRPRMFDERF
jgi:predicted restriction endonuclease